jgi:hypothetical protein
LQKLAQWLSYSCKGLFELLAFLSVLLIPVCGTQQLNPHRMPMSNIRISKNGFSEEPYFALWLNCNFSRILYSFHQIPINFAIEYPDGIKSNNRERLESGTR